MAEAEKRIYSFSLLIAGVDELSVAMADALFEAGCDDGVPWSSEGVVAVAFDREAGSLGDAIGSAVDDVGRAGYVVARVDCPTSRPGARPSSTASWPSSH